MANKTLSINWPFTPKNKASSPAICHIQSTVCNAGKAAWRCCDASPRARNGVRELGGACVHSTHGRGRPSPQQFVRDGVNKFLPAIKPAPFKFRKQLEELGFAAIDASATTNAALL